MFAISSETARHTAAKILS